MYFNPDSLTHFHYTILSLLTILVPLKYKEKKRSTVRITTRTLYTPIATKNKSEKDCYIFWSLSQENTVRQGPVPPDDEDKSDAKQDVAEVGEHSGEVWQRGKGSETAGVPEAEILLAMMHHHLGKHHLSPSSLLSSELLPVSLILFQRQSMVTSSILFSSFTSLSPHFSITTA